MFSLNLEQLAAWDAESGHLNVVIETPKGSRNKFKYDPKRGLFLLHCVLPLGASFPYDFGFIPSTEGSDGDPLDVLLLMDEPAFPGCLIHARLIGVIEAKQRRDEAWLRNDRLLAVENQCSSYREIHSAKQLPEQLLTEMEHFFISYDEMRGKKFQPLGRFGPRRAEKLIETAAWAKEKKEK